MKVASWNIFCPTLFGTGASELVGEKAKELGMSKVMLVTEADLIKFGIATKVQQQLENAGLQVVVFDKVAIDAPTDTCDAGGDFAKAEKVDGIVAVGGGSSLDTAKAIALLTGNEGPINKYYLAPPVKRGIPLITIPTTAGTGSENTQYLVIADSETGIKKVPEYAPDLALVDPVLTYTLPKGQTAATGMDALAHCAEAITSKNWNPYAYTFAEEGIRIVMKWLPVAVKEPENEEAREKLAYAANLGGMAITVCGCQMGHAWAQCFGGMFHIPHGLGCAWGLPGAMYYAGKHCPEDAKLVAKAMGIPFEDDIPSDQLADLMAKRVGDLMREIDLPTAKSQGYSLEDCLSVAKYLPDDAAIQNAPKMPTLEEIKDYITVTYNAYV
ncbi:iron-containing alcohol dehydrogenase [Eubacterium barkeri]|uniref:1,3-propanediol dehydrogenase n=1 Tax=Eubacterium barkeri TaxID=1528 RepID=A0A1H3F8Y8_EUBBA|nr:iron-containing alcohol dehydrogenase [Eubacterium barkeri]SDX87442.1 1,3-propanediol dehydrogenase [Eubacterium barkeri]